MKFKNESSGRVFVAIGQGFYVKAGEEVEVEAGYAMPKRADNGSRRPSVIENLAPQLKPSDPAERTMWEQVPEPEERVRSGGGGLPTVEGLVANGIPRGQAEIIVRTTLEAALDALRPDEPAPKPAPKAAR